AALFLALLAQAYFRTGLASWSVGVAYILYDSFLLAFTASRTWRLMQPTPAAPTPPIGPRPTLGVIVAAHNEADVLGVTIDTLAAQRDP
ncbi:hypothetical protein ABTL19_19445, partial [Acinetobacter baumannii]